jgi:hypothetical protein
LAYDSPVGEHVTLQGHRTGNTVLSQGGIPRWWRYNPRERIFIVWFFFLQLIDNLLIPLSIQALIVQTITLY